MLNRSGSAEWDIFHYFRKHSFCRGNQSTLEPPPIFVLLNKISKATAATAAGSFQAKLFVGDRPPATFTGFLTHDQARLSYKGSALQLYKKLSPKTGQRIKGIERIILLVISRSGRLCHLAVLLKWPREGSVTFVAVESSIDLRSHP